MLFSRDKSTETQIEESIDDFSGYGLTTQPDSKGFLVGLLMVDRPRPTDPTWLEDVGVTFGGYQLTALSGSATVAWRPTPTRTWRT